MIAQLFLICIVLLLSYIYYNGKNTENYWKKRGVKMYHKNKGVGVFWPFLTTNRPIFDILHDVYKDNPKEPAVGLGSPMGRALYVTDIQNIKYILQGDYTSFSHPGFEIPLEDKLSDNLFFMNGHRWKVMRQHMSPLFTATKMKNMYYILDKCAQDIVEHLKQDPSRAEPKQSLETLYCFCSCAIAAALFGITSKSIFDSPFKDMAIKALSPTTKFNLKFAIANISIKLTKAINMTVFKDHEKFFINAIKQTIRQREQDTVNNRHDFADHCVRLQKNGMMTDPETGSQLYPSDEILAAQGFFFFLAGVNPTAITIHGILYELGRNPHVYEKLVKEIEEANEKCNGVIDYEAVVGMTYLEQVLNEALRLHAPIGFLSRMCVKDSVLPVGNIKVEKGTLIFTPCHELHHDPKHFEDPEVFRPERFENDNKNGNFTYQPFGKGHKICIGMRYAKLQVKACLVQLLLHFKIESKLEGDKLKFSKHAFQVRPSNMSVRLIPK